MSTAAREAGDGTAFQERLARFKSLLEDPALSLDAALARMAADGRPPALGELLARAALVRAFDRGMYEEVLAEGLPADGVPDFDDFVARPGISPVPGEPGSHWLGAGEREHHLLQWQDPSRQDELWSLHSRLEAYQEARRPGDTLTRLPHLVAVDQQRARALFEAAFAEADAAFDLPTCFALLGVLDAHGGQLGPGLQEARREARRRYRSRALFADAYCRTGTFHRREDVYRAFREVLDGDGPWIFHLHATGGMGKTMFLRWLLARELVPAGVACARVDFDELRLDAVRSHPWLALAPLLQQLDEQSPGQNLAGTTSLVEPYVHLLRPVDAAGKEAPPPDEALGDELVMQAGRALQGLGLERIVLVLDTLEVVTVFPDTFARIFDCLRRLHARVPALRVVLAGRYDIRRRVPGLAPALATEARVFELSRFAPDQAEDYLVARGIADPALRAAIVDKVAEPADEGGRAGCNPFKLALLADLALGSEAITPADIRSLPSADYQYLLERVIKRIPEQPLRWVVRYGVVPRRLTLDYVEQVMLGELRRALGGEAGDDTARVDGERPEHVRHVDGQDLWQRDPAADISAAALWEQLLRYESGRGWLSHSGGGASHPGVIRFHGDVVDPMRDLLSWQRIFRRLQRVSAGHFRGRADECARAADAATSAAGRMEALERWSGLACEAVFHAFQHDATLALPAEADQAMGAAATWRAFLDDPRLSDAPLLRLRIAREPLRREYCEDGELPRTRGGRALVDTDTLVHAHLAAGRCLLDAMRQTGAPVSRTELRRHAEVARRLAGASPAPGVARAIGLLDAHLMVLDGRPRDALAWLEAQHDDARDPSARLDAEWLVARARAAAREAGASIAFQAVVALMRIFEPTVPAWSVAREAAEDALARGQLEEARAWLADALGAAQLGGCDEAALELALRLGRLQMELGEHGAAWRLLEAMPGEGRGGAAVEAYRLRLQHALLRGSATLLHEARDLAQRAATPRERTDALMLAGEIAAALLRYAEAARHWADATGMAELEGGAQLLGEIALQQVRTRNRMGAHGEVLTIARSVESAMEADPALAARMRLECAISQARGLDLDGARAMLAPLLDGPPGDDEGPSTRRVMQRVQALALGLALRVLPADARARARLLDDLRRLERPARLQAMRWTTRARLPLEVPREWAASVFALLDDPGDRADAPAASAGDDAIDADVAFVQDLRRLEVHRVLGDGAGAAALLEELSARPHARATPLRALLLEDARRRLVRGGIVPAMPAPVVPAEAGALLQAVMRLHATEHALRGGDAALAAELLAPVEAALETEGATMRWDAWHMELTGRLVAADDPAAARHRIATAAGMYGLLGDLEERDRLATAYAEDAPDARRQRATVVPMGPGGRTPRGEAGAMLESLLPRAGSVLSQGFAAMLTDGWMHARDLLGELLYGGDGADASAAAGSAGTIGLLVPPNALAALPWELAALPGEPASGFGVAAGPVPLWSRVREPGLRAASDTVRFVQQRLSEGGYGQARVDGIQGPVTTALVRSFQERHGLAPTGAIDGALVAAVARATSVDRSRPRVLIVQPGTDVDSSEQTSYASRGGRELAAYYHDWASVEMVPGADSGEVLAAVSRLRPALIHLVAAVRETRGMVFIDFARRRRVSEGTPINATSLDGAVKRLYSGRPRPFLVFDAVRPSSTFDAALALGWRNALATELHHLRGFSGILATGLEQGWMLGNVADAILEGLQQGGTMGSLAQTIRARFTRVAGAGGEDRAVRDAALAYLGTALFAEDPQLPCLLF